VPAYRSRHHNLAQVIESVLAMSDDERDVWRRRSMERVDGNYSWDLVTDEYEKLLTGLTGKQMPDLN